MITPPEERQEQPASIFNALLLIIVSVFFALAILLGCVLKTVDMRKTSGMLDGDAKVQWRGSSEITMWEQFLVRRE